MAMRSQSFYSAMSSYFGAIGMKPSVVKKPEYPDFLDSKDCLMKQDYAKQYRFKKAEAKTKKIDKIVTALLIANFLIFIAFVPEAYYPFFLFTHFAIIGSGFVNSTFLRKRREKEVEFAFCREWFS